ncbi:FCPD, partial [Symbiodinium sp. KB8]
MSLGDVSFRGGAPSTLGGCTRADGSITVFGPTAKGMPIALWLDFKHYQALVGEVTKDQRQRAVPVKVGDVSFRGGAPSTGGCTRASSLGGHTASERVAGLLRVWVATLVTAEVSNALLLLPRLLARRRAAVLRLAGALLPVAPSDADVGGADQGAKPGFVCQYCDFVYENPSRNAVSSARAHHLTRYHGGAGLPGAIRVDYGIFRSLSKAECDAERFACKCPLCRFGLPDGAVASKYAKEAAVARHRKQRHPDVSNAAYQKAACAQAHARLRALARRRVLVPTSGPCLCYQKEGVCQADSNARPFQRGPRCPAPICTCSIMMYGTLNVCKALATKVDEVASIFREQSLLVLPLQEIDLNSASVVSVTAAFKRHGLCFFAGPSNGQCHRVGLVASLACKPLVLRGISEPSRVVAALTELRCEASVRKVVFASLYGQVGDAPAACALAREVVLQSSALDDDFAGCGPLPLTSPGRVRRIDHGIASRLIAATEVVSFCGCTDHLGRAYGLNLSEPIGCVAPLRAADVSEHRWLQVWRPFAAGFFKALSEARAWGLLSTAAEEALVVSDGGDVSHVVPRHALWDPHRPRHRRHRRRASLVLSRCCWCAFDAFIVGAHTSPNASRCGFAPEGLSRLRPPGWDLPCAGGVPDTMLDLIKDLYTGKTVRVSAEGELTEEFELRTGLGQGCCLAPLLFNVYLAAVMEEWYHIADTHLTLPYRIDGILRRHMDEVSLNKYATWDHMKLSDLGYADDAAFLTDTYEKLVTTIEALQSLYKQWGLTMSVERTEALVSHGELPPPIQVEETDGFDKVNFKKNFEYLGADVSTRQGSVGVPTQVGRRTGKWLAFDFVNDLEKAGIPISGWMQIARKNNESEGREKVFQIARWYTPKNPKSGQEPPDRKKEKVRGAPHHNVKRTFVEYAKKQQEWFEKEETFHVGVLKAEQELGGRDKLISRLLNDLQAKYGTTWMDLKEEDVVVDMTEEWNDLLVNEVDVGLLSMLVHAARSQVISEQGTPPSQATGRRRLRCKQPVPSDPGNAELAGVANQRQRLGELG